MKKSKLFLVSLTTFTICSAIAVSLSSTNNLYVKAETSLNEIKFNSTKNKFHNYTGNTAYDGEANVQTELGNDINFTYYQIKGISSTWHVLGSGGYFYNNSQIHGLSNINLSFKTDNASYTIYYSNDNSFDQSETFTSSISAPTTFDFNGYLPNYFKVVNNSGSNLNISSINLSFTCEYKQSTLTVLSEDETMGSVTGGGIKNSGDTVTITAIPNKGYSFAGWYSNSTLVSTDPSYSFMMPFEDVSYTAKFSINSYSLTLNNLNPDLGSVTGGGDYSYGSSVTIIATPNTEVRFIGWFDKLDNLISNDLTYTFTMPYENITYTAKFSINSYSVTLNNLNPDLGSVTGEGLYGYNQEVTLIATPNEHCSFFGWFDNDTLLSSDMNYSFTMANKNLNYQAKFVPNHYLYISSDDENKGTVTYPTEYGEGMEVTISANAKEGYALDYWYDDDLNEVSYDNSYTFTMPNHDVTLYASFTTGYSLILSTNDSSKATIHGEGQYKQGREVTVSVDITSGVFRGWYDENSELVSKLNPYTFTMPENNYSLIALIMSDEEANQLGIVPNISEDGKTITYGLYPQTNVNDSSLISSLDSLTTPEANGWYLYDGNYYAKVSAKPYKSSYTFDNGTTIESGTTYWFKCEPITWKVLSYSDGEYYILSKVLLDAYNYNISYKVSSYESSDIRSWLNKNFYNSAFELENSHIQTKTLSTNSSTYFQDKVFLPSYEDYCSSNYGFLNTVSATGTRLCKTTDWARARGAQNSTNYYGYYWTRSRYSEYSAYGVQDDGSINKGCSVDNSRYCIRPAIMLKIS
ncbi:MAG: DUF6273 domain-containing protein [Bacillales bacterium]|nr:DUF6273 domain-containing protein [Bacillales bacterium]MDY6003427.1 DUF6273 domain-containing protein [Bacilli bacterium]